MRRRRWIIAFALIVLGGGLGWLLTHSATLGLARPHPLMVRSFPGSIAQSTCGPGLLSALSWLDEPQRREATRRTLLSLAETNPPLAVADLGLGPGDTQPEIPGTSGTAGVALPSAATTLLESTDGLLLLVHAPRPADLTVSARRRGWIGPLLEEVARDAVAATAAVSETQGMPVLRVTLALEYADGETAEKALRRLTDAKGDASQLGLAAQPGYERIVRRTHLVVIRLDIDAGLAREKLRSR